ncbi:MAG: glycosyltransferase family 2 protein [Oscillospiraceae bacterium]|nr:glycosyltransferase family 2 protein [Oscillospiraceae bacterium]
MQPKVSVIIPVYNIEKYLGQCLESVCNQTLKEIQVIAVDDGSTDSSAAICKEFAARYPDILEYYHKENGGSASARNVGLEHARGEYIGFIDSDDWVEPDMYEKMYRTAVERDVDMVFCRTFEEECPGAYEYIFPREGYFTLEDMKREIFPYLLPCVTPKGNFRNLRWCNWLRICRRSVIEENHIRFFDKSRRCEDLGFSVACTINSKNYYYLNECLYHNRPNASSKSRNYSREMWKSIRELMKYLQQLTFGCKEYDFSQAMDVCVFYFCTMVIRNEMRLDDKRKRVQLIREVLEDSLCRSSIGKITAEGMNREYSDLFRLISGGDASKLIRHLELQRLKKEKVYPAIARIISLPGINRVYKTLRRR